MENIEHWEKELIARWFSPDAMNRHRGKIVSHEYTFANNDEIVAFVENAFADAVDFIRTTTYQKDFDGHEYENVKHDWVADVQAMVADPHLMDISKYCYLSVYDFAMHGWVREKMTFDGNGIATTNEFVFNLAESIAEDLKDFELMNAGVGPTDRNYISKVWFAGVQIKGDRARISYCVQDDSRTASGRVRRLCKKHYDARNAWELENYYPEELSTRVYW